MNINDLVLTFYLVAARDKFLRNIEKFLARTVPDPCAPLAQWERRLKGFIDAQRLRYQHAVLYTDILKEWRDRTEEPEPLVDDSSLDIDDLSQSVENSRQKWEGYVFHAQETDQKAITDWLQGFFSSTQASTKALEDLRAGVAQFEKTMKANKNHFTKKTLNWCIWGLLRSDLLTDEKRGVLTAIQHDDDARNDVMDDLNMRMETLDRWAWPVEGVAADQRRQVGSKWRFFQDEDIMDALLLRYIGVKWSVEMFKRLTAFAKAHTWLGPLNTVSKNDRVRRERFLGPAKDHTSGVQGRRLETYEADFFLCQLLRHEEEVDPGYETYETYESESEEEDESRGIRTRKSVAELKHSLVQLLHAEVAVGKRLNDEITVLQSDFQSFGPSIAHSTIAAVFTFFGVSKFWTDFFRTVLAVPIVFKEDGPNAKIRTRQRGTQMSSPLADVCSELMLFGMDFAVWQCTSGLRLYRHHDDFWLWGSENACIRGWSTISDFATVMGLDLNAEKSGSIRVSKAITRPLASSLPEGNVGWGFLKLSSAGYFTLDHALVEKHITALIGQLATCKSLFAWIRVWNSYGVQRFTNMLGGEQPSDSFGAQHVALMQKFFLTVNERVFKDDTSLANKIRKEIKHRFPSFDAAILDSFIFLPEAVGGLEVINPFLTITQLEGQLIANPEVIMDDFIQAESNTFQRAKKAFEQGQTLGLPQKKNTSPRTSFLPFNEFIRPRDQLSRDFFKAYEALLRRPKSNRVPISGEVEAVLNESRGSKGLHSQWLLEQYKDEMKEYFGGFNIVETKLLPMGLVNMARKRRIKWNV
ncbi:MAG: hypothetical protein Q9168_001897 [Polycauliona sp. 1 TL-2023]